MLLREETRYQSADAAVFCRTRDPLGALSNMKKGFPITLGDRVIDSTEGLYQALRYSFHPEIQCYVLDAPRPMDTKYRAYETEHLAKTLPGWIEEDFRVMAMRVALRLKAWSYPDYFKDLFATIGDKPIVELSVRDPLWGAKPVKEAPGTLLGVNMLGQLWQETATVLLTLPEADWLHIVGLEQTPLALSGVLMQDVIRTATRPLTLL